MAIKKSLELPNKTTGEYWKVVNVSYDVFDEKLSFRLNLYVNKAARDTAPLYPLQERNWSLPLSRVDAEDGSLIAKAYELLKVSSLNNEGVEQNWFVDALDV